MGEAVAKSSLLCWASLMACRTWGLRLGPASDEAAGALGGESDVAAGPDLGAGPSGTLGAVSEEAGGVLGVATGAGPGTAGAGSAARVSTGAGGGVGAGSGLGSGALPEGASGTLGFASGEAG